MATVVLTTTWRAGLKESSKAQSRPEEELSCPEPVQLLSNQINGGMSGAAVLDKDRNLVVGLVSETWFPDQSTKDRDTAWAVNARVLSFEPLSILLRDEPLPLLPALQPRVGVERPCKWWLQTWVLPGIWHPISYPNGSDARNFSGS